MRIAAEAPKEILVHRQGVFRRFKSKAQTETRAQRRNLPFPFWCIIDTARVQQARRPTPYPGGP